MSSMGDSQFASRFQRLVERIAPSTVNKMRPAERIGRVFSFDAGSGLALMLFPGCTVDELVEVRVPGNLWPGLVMEDQFGSAGYNSPSDVARVAGKTGDWYIVNYLQGGPASVGSAVAGYKTGDVKFLIKDQIDPGWLELNGFSYQTSEYPALSFYITGDPDVTAFTLPDLRNRLIMGAGSIYPLGSTEGVSESLRTLQHTHPIAAQSLGQQTNTANTGSANRLTQPASHDHGGAATGQADTGTNSLPRFSVLPVIKT